MKPLQSDLQEIKRTLDVLFQADDVVELRIPKTDRDGVVSGYFSDHAELAKQLAARNGDAAVYVTMNPCVPSLLARCANRVRTRVRITTSDRDIAARHWLLIDCDPARPAEISATDREHAKALERIRDIAMVLSEEFGWSQPVLGDSGNGGHGLYLIDLPNDDASTQLLARVLKALAARFDDGAVKIDPMVFNASRIIKAYGTVARKGDDLVERPHRLSRLLVVPETIEPISRQQLEELAARATPPPPPPRDPPPRQSRGTTTADQWIDDWLARVGIEIIKGPYAKDGGRQWNVRCPFDPEHGDRGDVSVFQGTDKKLAFHCFHAACSAKGWHELREKMEPGYRDRNDRTDPPNKTKAKAIFTYADVPCIWDFELTVRYIVPDLLPEGAITLITGDSGHGKTILATAMAGDIVTGGEFLGRQAQRRKVIYLDRENGLALVKKHLLDLHIEKTPDLIYWGTWCECPADGPASVSLLELARAEKPVLIFDSLIAFHPGDEQDASETRRYLQYFRNLAAAGATVILLHHIGKSDSARQYRGSTDIKASVDVAWLLEKLGDPAGLLSELRLVPFKNRIGTCNTIPVSFREGRFLTEKRAESNREIFERVVRTNPNSTGAEIGKLGMAAGLPKNRIAQLLVEGIQQGWLQIRVGKRNAKHYSLAEPILGEI